MSYDLARSLGMENYDESQSLWNRAMSYDEIEHKAVLIERVSIPLEQGNVLRPMDWTVRQSDKWSLNPFGTGQCLTTDVPRRS